MTTTSRPANGAGGFLDADWADRFNASDGIIEDYDGDALAITFVNATNEASFSAAKISINGFVMTVPAGERVPLPAPSSGSRTYYIGALYDPQLNVADGSGNASAQGPVRLIAYADGVVDTSNGKRFLVLWVVTRTSAALTGATKTSRRRWVGVALDYPDGTPTEQPGNEGNYPRGTLRHATGRMLIRTPNDNGDLAWLDPLDAGTITFPYESGIIARKADGTPVVVDNYAGWVAIRGAVERANGTLSTGNDVPLGKLPVGYRPGGTARFVCRAFGSDTGFAEVRVTSNGGLTLYGTEKSIGALDLSTIVFRQKG